MGYATEQEAFWAGDFAVGYMERNCGEELLAANLRFFSDALRRASSLKSCIEFGANLGMNLSAIKLLYPGIDVTGVEISEQEDDGERYTARGRVPGRRPKKLLLRSASLPGDAQ